MGGRYEAGWHCWPVIGRHARLPACSLRLLSTACSKIAGMLLVVPAAPSTKLQHTAPHLRCVLQQGALQHAACCACSNTGAGSCAGDGHVAASMNQHGVTLWLASLPAASLTPEDAAELVTNMQLAAPAADRTLLQLLTRWTKSGTSGIHPVLVRLALLCTLLCQHQGNSTQIHRLHVFSLSRPRSHIVADFKGWWHEVLSQRQAPHCSAAHYCVICYRPAAVLHMLLQQV